MNLSIKTTLLLTFLSCSGALSNAYAQSPAATPTTATTTSRHVPPDEPAFVMGPMSDRDMIEMMGMDDEHLFGKVMLDQLESRGSEGTLSWDARAWYGGDYNKVLLETEGERTDGTTENARTELLLDRVIGRWWNLHAGVRHDSGEGPNRTWAAFGVEGLAPYWFDLEAMVYVGDAGRTALRLEAQYDLRLTQRLILEPDVELNAYGKDDEERGIARGLSDLEAGLRLRYEIRREFAPYLGVVWERKLGASAGLVRASGESASDVRFVAGLKIWF